MPNAKVTYSSRVLIQGMQPKDIARRPVSVALLTYPSVLNGARRQVREVLLLYLNLDNFGT